jgi:hypothetical protein
METRIGDIKLIHHNNNPVVYARVEEITADVKPGWWQVRLMILQVPSREVTWILRDEYIDGGEFTMDGEPMQLKPVPPPQPLSLNQEPDDIDLGDASTEDVSDLHDDDIAEPNQDGDDNDNGSGKVVDLSSRRRNR